MNPVGFEPTTSTFAESRSHSAELRVQEEVISAECRVMNTKPLFFIHHSALITYHFLYGGGASRTHIGLKARQLSTLMPYQLGDASKSMCVQVTEGRGIEPL